MATADPPSGSQRALKAVLPPGRVPTNAVDRLACPYPQIVVLLYHGVTDELLYAGLDNRSGGEE